MFNRSSDFVKAVCNLSVFPLRQTDIHAKRHFVKIQLKISIELNVAALNEQFRLPTNLVLLNTSKWCTLYIQYLQSLQNKIETSPGKKMCTTSLFFKILNSFTHIVKSTTLQCQRYDEKNNHPKCYFVNFLLQISIYQNKLDFIKRS